MKRAIFAVVIGTIVLISSGCNQLSNSNESSFESVIEQKYISCVSLDDNIDKCVKLFLPTYNYAAFRYSTPQNITKIEVIKSEYSYGTETARETVGVVDACGRPEFRTGYVAEYETQNGENDTINVNISSENGSNIYFEQDLPNYPGILEQAVNKDIHAEITGDEMYPLYFLGSYDEEMTTDGFASEESLISADISKFREATIIYILFH